MNSAIYSGHIMHERFLPKRHRFRYSFFMWYLDLDAVTELPRLGVWFSAKTWALSRFLRKDYLGDPDLPLAESIRKEMLRVTGEPVTGKVFGLMNLRTVGLYFSPVNFYFGFDAAGEPSHLLAEVSNIPWNERHYYGYSLSGEDTVVDGEKSFKVSPFNPHTNQTYQWRIRPPGETVAIDLGVHDQRGHVFEAGLRLQRRPFTTRSARGLLLRKPVMTAFIVAGIYWQALRLFIKGVPYVSYAKEES